MKNRVCALVALFAIISPAFPLIFHGVATPPGGEHAWVVTIETTAVYHTSDFGNTWEPVDIPTIRDFFDVFFLTPDSGWTCGRAGDIWLTTDGGNSWSRVNLGGPKHAARIRFFDPQFGWAAGGDIVQLKTLSGGAEWEQVFLRTPPFPPGDTAEFQGVWFVDRNTGFLVAGHWPSGDTFLGGQGLIARTRAGGTSESWEVVYRSNDYDFYDVFFADTLTGWVVGGDDRNFRPVVLHTTDGGNNWVEQPVPAGAHFLRAVKFTSARRGWACGRQGTIIFTSDGGNTWVLENSGADSTLFDIDFADSLHGMAAGDGVVVRTTDGGNTWQVCFGGGVEEKGVNPGGPVAKFRCLPNPGRQIRFIVEPAAENLFIEIYDLSGNRVRTLPVYSGGSPVVWDGKGEDGARAIPGVYFARISGKNAPGVRLVLLGGTF